MSRAISEIESKVDQQIKDIEARVSKNIRAISADRKYNSIVNSHTADINELICDIVCTSNAQSDLDIVEISENVDTEDVDEFKSLLGFPSASSIEEAKRLYGELQLKRKFGYVDAIDTASAQQAFFDKKMSTALNYAGAPTLAEAKRMWYNDYHNDLSNIMTISKVEQDQMYKDALGYPGALTVEHAKTSYKGDRYVPVSPPPKELPVVPIIKHPEVVNTPPTYINTTVEMDVTPTRISSRRRNVTRDTRMKYNHSDKQVSRRNERGD